MKSEIFAQILKAVSSVTELEPEQILSSTKTDDLVAARSLFVHYCMVFGIPSVSIASFLHRRRTTSVSNYLSAYESYCKSSRYFRMMDSEISKVLSSCHELSHN